MTESGKPAFTHVQGKLEGFIRRQTQWLEKKNLKLTLQAEEAIIDKTLSEVQECTFHPRVNFQLRKQSVGSQPVEDRLIAWSAHRKRHSAQQIAV